MLEFFISVGLALIVLYVSEVILIRRHNVKSELSRKLVHMAHGLAAASWAFFLPYKTIIFIELLFFASVLVVKRARVFKGLSNVGRKTWGEIFFPLGVISVALMNPNKWIFAAAVLHLALADALAALVGTIYGQKEYFVFRQRKTIEGSLAFWLVSAAIIIWLFSMAPLSFNHAGAIILLLPLMAAMLENIGAYGTDNLIVPVFVAWLLMQTQL